MPHLSCKASILDSSSASRSFSFLSCSVSLFSCAIRILVARIPLYESIQSSQERCDADEGETELLGDGDIESKGADSVIGQANAGNDDEQDRQEVNDGLSIRRPMPSSYRHSFGSKPQSLLKGLPISGLGAEGLSCC
jgi:hypothetical protein